MRIMVTEDEILKADWHPLGGEQILLGILKAKGAPVAGTEGLFLRADNIRYEWSRDDDSEFRNIVFEITERKDSDKPY